MEKIDVQICKSIINSKSTTTIIDNSPLPSPSYPVLDSLSIETSDVESNPIRVIKLKNILKEATCVLEDIELNWILIVEVVVEKKLLKYHHLVIYDMIDSNRIWKIIILLVQS